MDHINLSDRLAKNAAATQQHRRFGLKLFAIYLLVYAGFIGTAAFAHDTLAVRLLFGVNLAVLYGLGLIALAFILAIVFFMLGTEPREPRNLTAGRS
ncbi:MAG TPA: DUF485 domain-containing protein [Polyangiaceae bacterium]